MADAVENEIERMQNAVTGFVRRESADKSIFCSRTFVAEQTVLRVVRICDVEVFSDDEDASKLIEENSLTFVEHGRSNPIALFVVGMDIILMGVALRLAAMESNEQHTGPSLDDFQIGVSDRCPEVVRNTALGF